METATLNKQAKTDYPILDVLANRWSPRAFDDRPIPEETLNSLFEAVRWSASSMNEQPWRFIYAHKGSEAHDKIVETLMEGNKTWAKEAPVLLITFIKTHFDRSGASNGSAPHDLGLAMGSLSAQATHEGIGLHQMGGFSREKAESIFEIPEGYKAVTAVALGYFGDPDSLPAGLREREYGERKRLSIKEFAFEESFKQ